MGIYTQTRSVTMRTLHAIWDYWSRHENYLPMALQKITLFIKTASASWGLETNSIWAALCYWAIGKSKSIFNSEWPSPWMAILASLVLTFIGYAWTLEKCVTTLSHFSSEYSSVVEVCWDNISQLFNVPRGSCDRLWRMGRVHLFCQSRSSVG